MSDTQKPTGGVSNPITVQVKNLFDVALANQVKQRIDSLQIDSKRQWGKMSVAQAAAHCASGLEMALGEIKPPRVLIGRLLGPVIKPKVFGNDEPFRRNSPISGRVGRHWRAESR